MNFQQSAKPYLFLLLLLLVGIPICDSMLEQQREKPLVIITITAPNPPIVAK